MLDICLRIAITNNNEVITFFFNIIEVENTSADYIKEAILIDLSKHGLNEDFLKEYLIAFISSGASNMLGSFWCRYSTTKNILQCYYMALLLSSSRVSRYRI